MKIPSARSPRVLLLSLLLVLAACSTPAEPPRLDALDPTSGGPGTPVALTGRFYDDVIATFCGVPLVDPTYEGGARVPAAPALLAPGAAYTTLRGLVPEVPRGTACEVALVRRGAPVDGATATFGALATIAATDDAYAAERDVPLVVAAPGVLANDATDGAGSLSAQLVADAVHGSVVLDADGSFTYTPDSGFDGVDAFTYRATDGVGTSAVASVAIDVQVVGNPPVAQDDAYATDEDVALIVAAPGVLENDLDLEADPLTVVLVAGPASGTVTLNATGGFTYEPDAEFAGVDAFTYRASDGLQTSDVASVAITVREVNDAPVAVDDAFATDRDVPLVGRPGDLLANDTDVDGDALTLDSVQNAVNGTIGLAAGAWTFTPAPGFVGAASFGYTVNDGRGGFANATVAVAVNVVLAPPVGNPDAYDALGNVPLAVAAPGVLANDVDPNDDVLAAVAGTIATTGGGSVALAADGGFTYVGAAGFTGDDTFAYTVEDATGRTSTGSVTLTVAGRSWFVDAAAPPGGDGRQGTPFASLAPISGAGGAGDVDAADDVILVRAGTYAGGLELEAGQQLIGQGIPADLTATVNGATVVLLPAGTAPSLTAAAGNAVTLAAGNTLRGFVAGSAPGAAIAGSAVGALTVSDVRIDNPAGRALDLSTSGTLAATFGTIAATGGTGAGLRIDGLGGTFTSGAVTIVDPTGTGIAVQSTSGTFTFGASSVAKANAGVGVDLAGTPTVAFASLTATTAAGSALRVAGGTATVSAGSLAATGGLALEASDATLAASLTSASSTNSPTRGVALTNVAGSVALGGGAIGGAAGEAFFVSGGTATVAYTGTITNAAGRAVAISSRSGGSVALSGSITDTGTGVLVQNVTGGSVAFSGPSVALTTGANPAVMLTSNVGGTVAFTGGGLALATTSGAGFTATGGGTVSVTGAANTIATQTGTAVNVANTTIAAAGLVFRSVSAGTAVAGPTNAIVLSATGTLGGLTVSGDGATAGSGGLLQRTTGTAVVLSATHGPQLRFVQILRPGLHGVLATNATGALAFDRGSIDYENTSVVGAYALRLENTSTNATLTVDGARFAGKLDANPALSVSARGTSVLTVAVRDSNPADAFASRYTGLFGPAIAVAAGDDAGSTARVNVSVTATTFEAAATGGGNGVSLTVAQSAVLVPTIDGNTFDRIGLADAPVGVIDLVALGLGQVGVTGTPGTFTNNVVQNVRSTAGTYAVAGLEGYRGLRIGLDNVGGAGFHLLRVAGNTVQNLASSGAYVGVFGSAVADLVLSNNTIGVLAAPVGVANRPGVQVEVGGSAAVDLDVLDHGIVAGSAGGFAPAVLLRSGAVSVQGGTLNATVLNNSIAHLNAAIDSARFEMETDAGSSASACLDLRGNALDAGTRRFVLAHDASGSFARNVPPGSNLGVVAEFGSFATVGSCPRPSL